MKENFQGDVFKRKRREDRWEGVQGGQWMNGHRSRKELGVSRGQEVQAVQDPGKSLDEFSGAQAREGFGAGRAPVMGLCTIPLAAVEPLGACCYEPGERWGSLAPDRSNGHRENSLPGHPVHYLNTAVCVTGARKGGVGALKTGRWQCCAWR